MHNIVKKTLEIYLKEKRIITQSELTTDEIIYINDKNPVFVTIYHNWKVIASQGRIQCKKENTLMELIDISLACLKDSRFSENLANIDAIANLQIRVDLIEPTSRRMLKDISELSVRDEWIIFLSQNLKALSVILPNMIKINPTAQKYFEIAKQKANITQNLEFSDYVIYWLKTKIFSNF